MIEVHESAEFLEFQALVQRSGVPVKDEDLAAVLAIFRENEEGLQKLRQALAETDEPASGFVDFVRRNLK